MYDKNVKSQRILTELRAVDSEYVCKKPQNFVQKYCLTAQLAFLSYMFGNLQIVLHDRIVERVTKRGSELGPHLWYNCCHNGIVHSQSKSVEKS